MYASAQTTELTDSVTTFDVYFTSSAQGGVPLKQPKLDFDCSDTIFTVLEAKNLPKETHLLEVLWFDPTDRMQQRTRYEFLTTSETTRVWAWLRLSGPTGAAIGRMFDPSFGMGDFIGTWHIEIRIDKELLATKPLSVLC